jgi:lipopolysaccharide heptosyltransferase I
VRDIPLPDRPRILIVRLSAIGDTIHSLPLAAAIRKARPQAHIGWLVEQPAAAIVERNPLLDWTHVIQKGWLKRPSQVAALRRDLRAQRFDVAVDVQGLTKSAVAAHLSGAKIRLGFTKGESRELAPWLDNRKVAPAGTHIIDKSLSLLRGLGLAVPEQGEFALPPCGAEDARTIAAFAEAMGEYVLMGPWGTFAAKLWPLERFLELAKRLRDEYGVRSAMLGHGETERSAVAALAARSGGALVAAPEVGLVGVAELARRARLFVGCDSFPMHAAAAVGCAAIGLFGITDPARLGPYGPKGRAVYAKLTLPGSTRERRLLNNENMLALDADTVFAECAKMWRPSTRM